MAIMGPRRVLRKVLFVFGSIALVYGSLVALFLLPTSPISTRTHPLPTALGTLAWMLGQWSPAIWGQSLSELGWVSFEQAITFSAVDPLDIPTVDLTMPTVRDNPLEHIIQMYGEDWISRPLLLKGVWSKEELQDPKRRLSIHGLAQDPLVLPYFSDARQSVLTPDSEDSLIHIVEGIRRGMPHKIGSQEYLKAYPDRLGEVAPPRLVATLFGERFTQDRLLGHIYSPLSLIQGPMTVPIFVANAKVKSNDEEIRDTTSSTTCNADLPNTAAQPFTGLHCEPIGNVSVQLAGAREWTLVQPEYWTWLRPTVSPDSRGFFASWAPNIDHVPRYRLRTLPGDALWVPPWTWHRVDYGLVENGEEGDSTTTTTASEDTNKDATISVGASLFHFRPVEFVKRNPIYALLLAPYLFGELVGTKTQ